VLAGGDHAGRAKPGMGVLPSEAIAQRGLSPVREPGASYLRLGLFSYWMVRTVMIKPRAAGSAWRRAWWWLPLTGASLAMTGMLTAAAQPSPAPGTAASGITGVLNAVSAVSASDVWAVGSTGTTGNVPLIVHWNGKSWSNADRGKCAA
jgi:hypothetical protein